MKRVLRFLIRLYPAWWRRRYGQELEALLEDSGSGLRDVSYLFRGAMEIQMKTWSFGGIVIVCGIAGLVLAGVMAFSMPYPYLSTAVLKIPAGAEPADVVNNAAQVALSRRSLVTIVNDQKLYPRERKDMPMEDVIDKVMRPDIHITPIMSKAGVVDAVVLRFASQDPSATQPVTQALVERFSGFEVVDRPSAPRPVIKPRSTLTGLGLIAGMLFGVVVALILRRRALIA